jgi:hypothetical protein
MATFDKSKVPLLRYLRRRRELASGFASAPGLDLVVFRALILASLEVLCRSRNNQEPTKTLLKELVLNSSSNKVAFAKAVESDFISAGGPFELSRMESICLSLAEEDAKSTNQSKYRLPQSFWLRVLKYLGHFRASLVIYCPLDATRPRMKDFSSWCLMLGGGKGFRPDLPEEDRVKFYDDLRSTKYYQTHLVEWNDICLRAALGVVGAKSEKRQFLEECAEEVRGRQQVPVASVNATSKSPPPAPGVALSSNLPGAAASSAPDASAVPVTPRRSERITRAPAAYVNAGNGTPPKKRKSKKEDERSAPDQPVPPPQKKDQIEHSKGGAVTQDQGEDQNQREDRGGEKKILPAPSAKLLSLQSDLKIATQKCELFEMWVKMYRACLEAEGVVLVDALR